MADDDDSVMPPPLSSSVQAVTWKKKKAKAQDASANRATCLIGMSCLLYKYYQILTRRPEKLRVGDTQHILLVGIALKGVRTGRV